jgi:predicted nucleic acid-binding protein
VRLVIADTGPINYLILIGNIDLLPALFENVILPSAVEGPEGTDETVSHLRKSKVRTLQVRRRHHPGENKS